MSLCLLYSNSFILELLLNTSHNKSYSLLLKGGHVIDPSNDINNVMDVAVSEGRIAHIDAQIPSGKSEKILDVSGYFVTPGLIDMHGHVFHTFGPPGKWVIPDHHSFQSGVTTVVDAGTSGADSFGDFKAIIDCSKTRILAFLNIASPGKNEAQEDPSTFDVMKAVKTAQAHPEIIVGFKSCDYVEKGFDVLRTPWASVDSVLAAGNAGGLPIMISFIPSPPEGDFPARSYRELILERLRPGDIHTCMFMPVISVILENGTLNPDLIDARKRGVLFDGTHGAGSLVFRNMVPAVEQNFIPDTISTDLHGNGRTKAVVDLLNVMSKFLCAGMRFEDVIRCTTSNPAREINRPELGNLSIGSAADIAVIEKTTGTFSYVDTGGGTLIGNTKLQIVMTLFGGEIVFDPTGVGGHDWKSIPIDNDYWKNPSGQNW